jgi:hypothetical protein
MRLMHGQAVAVKVMVTATRPYSSSIS